VFDLEERVEQLEKRLANLERTIQPKTADEKLLEKQAGVKHCKAIKTILSGVYCLFADNGYNYKDAIAMLDYLKECFNCSALDSRVKHLRFCDPGNANTIQSGQFDSRPGVCEPSGGA
jgi:hypothetical protein